MKRRQWRKAEYKLKSGYRLVSAPDHPAANKNGYVLKHRLLAESILGRYLIKDKEYVCFINKKKKVAPENIMVFNSKRAATLYSTGRHNMIDQSDIVYSGLQYLVEKRRTIIDKKKKCTKH